MLSFLKNLLSFHRKTETQSSLLGIELADSIFQNLVAEEKVPGISVTILQNGETILKKGYGHANLEEKVRVSPDASVFRIASISKCITGLALGKMVEEGILNWDDSFFSYVPYYPKKRYDFTLRQLASHTAGIRGYRGKEFALNQPFSIKDSIEVFKEDPLVFQPGKGYLYNSFDFVLLSLAMQEASGVPFENYVKEKILVPLGMKNTVTPKEVSTVLDHRTVEYYTKRVSGFQGAVEVDNFYKLAGGGYLSTSEDIAKLGQAVLEQKLLKPNTYRELLTAQTVNEKSTYYGLGFQVSQDNSGRHFVGHVGNSVGAYTNFFVYPSENIVICTLSNSGNSDVQGFLDDALKSILDVLIV
jgi:CubicO group peptidase (beta-lactamase class C family)